VKFKEELAAIVRFLRICKKKLEWEWNWTKFRLGIKTLEQRRKVRL